MAIRNLISVLVIAVTLTACHGTGFNQFNSGTFWTTETAEEAHEESWWDKYWGRKVSGHESTAWKEHYLAPNLGPERYENCGYWGSNWQNCRGMTPPTGTPNCDFYGNCQPAGTAATTPAKNSLGW